MNFPIYKIISAVIILILIELYSFLTIRIATKNYNPLLRLLLTILYILLSVGAWSLFLYFRKAPIEFLPLQAKSFLFAGIFGFFAAKILAAILMFFDDARRLIQWTIRSLRAESEKAPIYASEQEGGITRSKFIVQSSVLMGGLLLGGFTYGVTNRYKYIIKRVKLKIPDLPDAFKGMKIVQISDIHAGSFDQKEAVKNGINLILQEEADLILFTGDLVNYTADEIEPYMDIFSELKAPLGVYSILGNHDYGDYVSWTNEAAKVANLELLKKYQADMGWKLLLNEHVLLKKGEDQIALIGVENWGANPRFPRFGDMQKALHGMPNNIPVKILLTHDPSHWDAVVRPKYPNINLTLSGHTHGMQMGIRLPFFQWSPAQFLYKQWAGLYTKGQQSIYVNVGYGFLGYPGRLGILPEITVIELS